jgi:hypothetical protein
VKFSLDTCKASNEIDNQNTLYKAVMLAYSAKLKKQTRNITSLR